MHFQGLNLDNRSFFCTLIFQIFKYLSQILSYPNKPYINENLFIQLSVDV